MSATLPVPSAGILAGNGAAMVHALVYHHPVPQQVPAAFAEFVDPVPGEAGKVQDWQLSMRKLLAHRETPVHDVWKDFATWRRTFVAERVVGDCATIHAFLAWADHRTDVSSLHALNLHNARIEPGNTPLVAWQVSQAETACRAAGEQGLGVTVPERAGLVRGFVVGDEPVLLLADRDAEVSAVRAGIELVDRAQGASPARVLVHGWVVDTDGVTAISDEGPVALGNARSGRLLAQIAPGCVQVSVGPVPLVAVFSTLFVDLREMAQEASFDQLPLYVRTGPPML